MAERESEPLRVVTKRSPTPSKSLAGTRTIEPHISTHSRRRTKTSRDMTRLREPSQMVQSHLGLEQDFINGNCTSMAPKTTDTVTCHDQEEVDNDDEKTLSPTPQRRRSPPSLLSPMSKSGLRNDPFGSMPIPADGCVPLTIDYFLHEWAPEYDSEYALVGRGRPHTCLVFPLAMNHAVLLESLVAMCRVFWLIARDLTWHTDAEYIKHQGRALALLQAKLGSEAFADNATLLAIVCLTSIELLASNYSAVVAHAHGLNMLMKRRTDKDDACEITEYTKSSARAHGMLGEYIKTRTQETTATAPRFPGLGLRTLAQPLSYPRHPFPPRFCAKLASLPDGFSELALSGSLSVQCICIISSLSRKIQRHGKAQTAISSADQTADIRAELDALLHFYTMAKSPMEEYLTNGLISFCNQYPDRTTRNPSFNVALKCFNSALDDREKLVGVWRQDYLVWVAVVIAGVLDICAEPLSSRHVLLDSCLADYPRAQDWDHLEQILRSFFWTDVLGKHWKQCWEAAMHRRQIQSSRTSPVNTPKSPGKDASSLLSMISTSNLNGLPRLQDTGLGRLLHDAHNLTKAFIQAKT